jgi:hypothetical protein
MAHAIAAALAHAATRMVRFELKIICTSNLLEV